MMEGMELVGNTDVETDAEADTESKPPLSTQKRVKTYSVDEAINKMGFGPFQILITVFAGGLWMADAMELMILSVLSPAVKCQWNLSESEEALITSIVFVGFFFGMLFWGVVFDMAGRKTGLVAVNIVVLLFGVLSAVPVSSGDSKIPGFPWLLVCRCGVGFGAGGTGQAVTYYTEFLPVKARGACIVLLDIWWAFGAIFGAVLALLVLGLGGLSWHWYLAIATVPLFLVSALFLFVPESARFYLVKGKNDKAQKVLERVAWFNRCEVPPGKVVLQEEKDKTISLAEEPVVYSEGVVTISDSQITSYDVTSDKEGDEALLLNESHGIDDAEPLIRYTSVRVKLTIVSKKLVKDLLSLFSKDLRVTTTLLLFLWCGAAWLYYGIILLTTTLLQYDPHCGIDTSLNSSNSSNSSLCEENQLDTNDYLKIMWASLAEIPGVLITLFIIEILGRKITMAVEFLLCMVGFFLLFICTSSIVITLFLFTIRAFATGVFQAIYVYTPEIYPTKIRAFSLGVHGSAARIGGLVTPYVAQVLIHASDYATLSLYAGSSLVLAVLALLLPIETKGRALGCFLKL